MIEMLCKDCDAIVAFVTPDCSDWHGDSPEDCGELMCVICGTAITIGGMLLVETRASDAA